MYSCNHPTIELTIVPFKSFYLNISAIVVFCNKIICTCLIYVISLKDKSDSPIYLHVIAIHHLFACDRGQNAFSCTGRNVLKMHLSQVVKHFKQFVLCSIFNSFHALDVCFDLSRMSHSVEKCSRVYCKYLTL